MDLFVKLFLGLVILQTVSPSYSRYIPYAEENDSTVVQSSNEINGELEQMDSDEFNRKWVHTIVKRKDSSSSDTSSSSSENSSDKDTSEDSKDSDESRASDNSKEPEGSEVVQDQSQDDSSSDSEQESSSKSDNGENNGSNGSKNEPEDSKEPYTSSESQEKSKSKDDIDESNGSNETKDPKSSNESNEESESNTSSDGESKESETLEESGNDENNGSNGSTKDSNESKDSENSTEESRSDTSSDSEDESNKSDSNESKDSENSTEESTSDKNNTSSEGESKESETLEESGNDENNGSNGSTKDSNESKDSENSTEESRSDTSSDSEDESNKSDSNESKDSENSTEESTSDKNNTSSEGESKESETLEESGNDENNGSNGSTKDSNESKDSENSTEETRSDTSSDSEDESNNSDSNESKDSENSTEETRSDTSSDSEDESNNSDSNESKDSENSTEETRSDTSSDSEDESNNSDGNGSKSSSEEKPDNGKRCSVFPTLTKCLQRDMTSIFNGLTMDIFVEKKTSSPMDFGFDMFEALMVNSGTPEAQILGDISPMACTGFGGILGIMRSFKQSISRLFDFLNLLGILPPSFAGSLESPIACILSNLGLSNPLFNTIGFNLLPSISSNKFGFGCTAQEHAKFWKITALRAYLKHGLRLWLWVGVPRADVEKIRDTVIKFLKDEFKNEFDCPLDYSPNHDFLLNETIRIFRAKIVRALDLITCGLLKWTNFNPKDKGTIMSIIEKFTRKLKEKDIVWDRLPSFLESIFDKTRGFILSHLGLIFRAEFPNTIDEATEIWKDKFHIFKTGLIKQLSPAKFTDMLATFACQLSDKIPDMLAISDILSTANLFKNLQPLPGVTWPQDLVDIISNNIPAEIARIEILLKDFLEKLKSMHPKQNCQVVMKNAGLFISQNVETFQSLLSKKSLKCISQLKPTIDVLSLESQVKLVQCMNDKVANISGLLADIQNLKNDLVNYFDALKDITTETIVFHIANGSELLNRLKLFVEKASHLTLSEFRSSDCAEIVKENISSSLNKIKHDISECSK